jgi:hypothetical protein
LAEGVTLTSGHGVTLTTDEDFGDGVTLTTDEDFGDGVTLTTGEDVGDGVGDGVGEDVGDGVGDGVGEGVAPAVCCGSKQSAVDEATAMITIKDSTNTREIRILDPPACNDNY